MQVERAVMNEYHGARSHRRISPGSSYNAGVLRVAGGSESRNALP